MRPLVDVVLQVIERLSALPNDVIFKGVTVEREVVSDVPKLPARWLSVCPGNGPSSDEYQCISPSRYSLSGPGNLGKVARSV
jgi:hypothetical protein